MELKYFDIHPEAPVDIEDEMVEIVKEVLPDYKEIMMKSLEENLLRRERDDLVRYHGKSYNGRVRDIERMVRDFKEKSKVDDQSFHNRLESLTSGLKMGRTEGRLGRDPFV